MTLLPLFHGPRGGLPRPQPDIAAPVSGQDLLARPLALARGVQREELFSLAEETDPALRSEALLNFGVRQEQAGQMELAGEVFQIVASLPGESYQARARSRLDAMIGRGAFGNRAEFLLRNLAQQATEPTSLLAMGAAGTVFRMTRLAVLSRLASSAAPGFLTRFIGAGRLASLAGFALEAPTFTLAGRLGNEALGRSQDWRLPSLGRDLASSYLVLGGLKLTGALGSSVARRLEASAPLATLLQQGSQLSGILLGHRLEAWAGLRTLPDGATTLTDSLAMLLQFHMAGNLSRSALGPHFAAWEESLERQSRSLESQLEFPRFGGSDGLQPALATAAGPREVSADQPSPVQDNILMMAGRGPGGRRPTARTPVLPVEVRYWLSLVDSTKVELGVSAVARLVENLRTGEGLNSRQYVDLFHQLNKKLESYEIQSEPYDLIIRGLDELLEKVDLNDPGPRGLLQDLLRSHRVEDALIPGYYTSFMKNPSLRELDRSRIVAHVVDVLRADHKNESPRDGALSFLMEAPLEHEAFSRLSVEAARMAERESTWFNDAYHQTFELVPDLIGNSRVPLPAKTQLLDVLVRGLRDPQVSSLRRVKLIATLEQMYGDAEIRQQTGEWFEARMMEVRESFVEDNFDELRRNPKTFNNLEELGFLLTQDYLEEETRAVVARELLDSFRLSSPTSGRYDHLADLAMFLAPNPSVPEAARRCLWSIVLKTAHDLEEAPSQSDVFSDRRERMARELQEALGEMPRPERSALALHWLDRMSLPNPALQSFASAILKALAPYLEPTFELRERLAAAQTSSVPELRNLADRMLLRFNRVN